MNEAAAINIDLNVGFILSKTKMVLKFLLALRYKSRTVKRLFPLLRFVVGGRDKGLICIEIFQNSLNLLDLGFVNERIIFV